MTPQQKTIAFWSGIALMAVVAVFFIVSIRQKLGTAPTTNQVSFTGEGKVNKQPDIAIADFSVITTSITSKAAQDANTASSKKVYEFLKKQGVEEKDIKNTYYNVQPQYADSSIIPMPLGAETQIQMAYPIRDTSQPKITGYQVTQSYQVKIRDLEKVSAIVDGLVTAGANQVGNVYFDFENRDAELAKAREEAIADAKKKAEALEDQIGIRLGKIVNYYEGGYPSIYYAKGMEMGMGGGSDTGGPILPPGENEITVNVTITYQIK